MGRQRKLGSDGHKLISLVLLLAISLVVFGYTHSLNTTLLRNLYYGYTDLVYFEQSLNNFIHGHGLVNTGRGEVRSLFSEHAYFSHFLVSLPFYWLVPRSLTLFDLAAIHVLAALFIAFYLAKKILKNTALAWACYALFLTNTFLITSAGSFWRYGFHSEVFYLPYFLALIYFWDKNKAAAVVFFSLALLTKETSAIPLFMAMLYFFIKEKGRTKTAPVLAGVCVLYFILVTKWLMPLFGAGKTAYQYYGLRLDSVRAFGSMLLPKALLGYWKGMLIHFHFLPVLSPQIWLLAWPDSLVNASAEFVMDYGNPANPAGWHSIPVYGFMIWACLLSFKRLALLLKKNALIYPFSLVLLSFSVYLLSNSPVPREAHTEGDRQVQADLKTAQRLMEGSDSLCVASGFAAPFMHKRYLYHFPEGYEKAEYIICGHRLRDVQGIDTEILIKSPRLLLLRNLSYRPPPQ
jgi:uncharacterized membrane protein